MAGSVIGGIFGNKAAKKQASAIKDAARIASDTQKELFERSVELSEPWRGGGENALLALQYELGLLGEDKPILGADTRYRVGDVTFDDLDEAKEFRKDMFPSGGGGGGGGSPLIGPFQNPATYALYRGDAGALQGGIPTPEVQRQMQAAFEQDLDLSDPNVLSALLRGVRSGSSAGGAGGGFAAGDIPNIEEFTEGGHEYLGFQKTPGYEFQLDEGQRAINRSLAARGKLLSGPAVKEGTRFAQGLADQTYSNHLARLAQLSGLGGGVAQSQGANAITTGQGLANTALTSGAQIGNARASGYAALGQGIGGGINALAGLAGMAFGGGGTGFGAGNMPFGSFGF